MKQWKLKNRPHFYVMIMINGLSLLALIVTTTGAWAQERGRESGSIVSVSRLADGFFVEGLNGYALNANESAILRSAWEATVARHPGIRFLPNPFGVVIDPEWRGSAGFSTPNLSLSNGIPAVLLVPQVLQESRLATRIFAHELTHYLIDRAGTSASWWSEMLALLIEYRVTGLLNSSVQNSFGEPETSLFQNLSFESGELRDRSMLMPERLPAYGHVLQFGLYLDRVCFSGRLLDEVFSSSGIATVQTPQELMLWARSRQSPIPAAAREAVCEDFQTLFTRFERARYLQTLSRPLDHVVATSVRARVFPSISSLNANPPEYSAQAYRLNPGQRTCASDDLLIERQDGLACLRLTFEVTPPQARAAAR